MVLNQKMKVHEDNEDLSINRNPKSKQKITWSGFLMTQ